jgi:hypothetical protein
MRSNTQRELVDQRDVDVALRVLDDLRGFGDRDARCAVRAGRDDAAVEPVDVLGGRFVRSGDDLDDRRQPVFLVAGIDALGAVAREEVDVVAQPRLALDDRHADFLGATRVDRRLVDHDVAALDDLADRAARRLERPQVRALVFVDRRRHRHDEGVAFAQIVELAAVAQPRRGAELVRRDFERAVLASTQGFDARRIDVVADRGQLAAELDRERKADIAEPDHGEARVVERATRRVHRGFDSDRVDNVRV